MLTRASQARSGEGAREWFSAVCGSVTITMLSSVVVSPRGAAERLGLAAAPRGKTTTETIGAVSPLPPPAAEQVPKNRMG